MIDLVMFVVAVLFSIKLLWNVLTPFELVRRTVKNTGRAKGLSLDIFSDIVLWSLLCVISEFSDGRAWFNKPKLVVLWGGIAIASSYIILVAVGALLNRIFFSARK